MPHTRQKLGDYGESSAAAHLIRAGYQVIARKWRCALGEIDLVVRDGDQLVFVEVRTRRGTVPAAESVTIHKQRRLVNLALMYLQSSHAAETQLWRIDVIAISIDRNGQIAQLDHIRSAVESG
jgi:putative endonuclease